MQHFATVGSSPFVRWVLHAAAVVAALLLEAAGAAGADPEGPPEGLTLRPAVSWSRGDHRVDLSFEGRFRYESWKALTSTRDGIYGFRTRLGLDYSWKDRVRVFAQGQHTAVLSLSPDSSGAGGLYRADSTGGNSSSTESIRVRQLFAESKLAPGSWVRAGRQDINGGTLVGYAEPNWKFLKIKRLSQRLVGTVGWANGERSYDGVAARAGIEGHVIHAFAAEPTTGVFDIEDAYERQKDVILGGFDWTVERGTWLRDTELRGFFVAYSDDRNPAKVAGLFGDIEVYTLGVSWLGVYPVGPGKLDVLLWGALQLGDYTDKTPSGMRELDQRAGAVIAELGYQLPQAWGKPWLRAGVNFASGDGSPDDGDHNTFFNVMPTNHLYYGYADQLAFQNLVDLLVQLKLAPFPKAGLELTFHQFWLAEDDDRRYFGTGAFNRRSLGFGNSPSNGSHDVGREIDVVGTYKLHRHVAVAAGYSRLFGGDALDSPSRNDVDWAFAQLLFTY